MYNWINQINKCSTFQAIYWNSIAAELTEIFVESENQYTFGNLLQKKRWHLNGKHNEHTNYWTDEESCPYISHIAYDTRKQQIDRTLNKNRKTKQN